LDTVRPYEIHINAPDHQSGGVRALHALKEELLDRGIPAWMSYEPHWDPDCIGVYPEVTPFNPEHYDRFVRWKLNTAILPSDVPVYAWEKNMGNHPLLTVNIIEMDLWKPYTGKRNGVAYWVGKGTLDPVWVPEGAEEITRSSHRTREDLAELIRSLDYLISFDPFTAVNLEAAISGTPVLIRGEHPKLSRKEIQQHNWTPYGVAYSMSELDEARRTVHLAYEHYESLLPVFSKRVDDFVEQTQKVYP
jgi:hypothetical protein